RVDLENAIEEVRSMAEPDAIRYRLNRFVGSVNAFLSAGSWADCTTRDPWPAGVRPVFTVDRTPDWSYATIGAFALLPDGSTYCDVVASFVKPTQAQLADVLLALSRHNPRAIGMDGYTLRALGKDLEARGLPVAIMTQ